MANSILLIGRVLNESGDAVSDATIVAVTDHFFQRHPIEAELWEGKGLLERPNAQKTRTDDMGRFEFHEKLSLGKVLSVSVVAEGYAPLRYTHERLSRDLPHDMGDLVLQEGHAICGTVADAKGAPISDVQVLMAMERGVPGNYQSFPGRGIPLTQTDSRGRFTAAGLLPGRWCLLFDKAGYRVVEKQGNFFNDPKPNDLSVTLDRGSSISGRVLNFPAEHVGNLMVEARPIRKGVDYVKQFPSRARPRRALVLPDGSFHIAGLNETPFQPDIQPFVVQGYHPQVTAKQGTAEIWLVVGLATEPNQRLIELPEFQSCRVELGQGETNRTNIELPWLGRVRFSARVVNELGDPVEVQSVEVRYETGFGPDQDTQQATILPGGRIELYDYAAWDSHLHYWNPSQNICLWIRAVGYEFCEVEITGHLKRGELAEFGDIALKATQKFDLKIVDTAGESVSRADLRLAKLEKGWLDKLTTWAYESTQREPGSWAWNFPCHCLNAETNDEGNALLSTVADEAEMLSVCHPDYAFQVHEIEATSDESGSSSKTYPSEIQLAPAGKIKLKVVDDNGQPAAWRPVYVKALDTLGTGAHKSTEMRGYCLDAETDDRGMACFERLSGRYLVALKHPEGSRRPESHIADNEQAIVEVDGDDVAITLVTWPLCEFSVSVRESDRPVVGATLHMMSEYLCTPDASYKHLPFVGFTGDRGHYRFRDVPSGDYLLQVNHDDRNMIAHRKVHVGPYMEPVDWLLDNNTITGKLVDHDGAPLPHKCIGVKTKLKRYTGGNHAGITYETGRGDLAWFWSGPWIHETWTDSDGNFHLRGIIANVPLYLYTSHNTLIETKLDIDPLHDDEQRQGITFIAALAEQ